MFEDNGRGCKYIDKYNKILHNAFFLQHSFLLVIMSLMISPISTINRIIFLQIIYYKTNLEAQSLSTIYEVTSLQVFRLIYHVLVVAELIPSVCVLYCRFSGRFVSSYIVKEILAPKLQTMQEMMHRFFLKNVGPTPIKL